MHQPNELKGTMRIALYIRVSTEEQAERYGIPLQKDSLLALIKSRGKLGDGTDSAVLAGEEHIYIDDGISGTVPLDERPAFSRLKEAILNAPEGNRPFDAVAVFKIDRFARRLKILLELIDFFDEYDIKFLSANESIDTSTPFGKAILGIIGVIAELELETTKQRTRGGREQASKAGKFMGRVAPYGFAKNVDGRLERLDEEAKLVERIFDLFVNEKMSTQGIASLFTREKILSPAAAAIFYQKTKFLNKQIYNEFWRAETVMKILKNEKYIGKNYYNLYEGRKGMKKPKSDWKESEYRLPQIINPFIFEKAQRLLLSQKHTRRTSHSDHLYLLSGLLRCDACSEGTSDYAYWIGARKELDDDGSHFTYFYKCGRKNKLKSVKECQVIPLPAKEVENFILEECLRIMSNPKGVYEYQQKLVSTKSEIRQLQKKQGYLLGLLNAIPRQREIIRGQNTAGIIDIAKLKEEFEKFGEREKELKKELDFVEERLSQKTLSEGYIKSLEMFSKKYAGELDNIKRDRRKSSEVLHALIDSIVVYSRPVVSSDSVAGKKKEGQNIPNGLSIKLKLPHEFLTESLMSSGQKAHNGGDGV